MGNVIDTIAFPKPHPDYSRDVVTGDPRVKWFDVPPQSSGSSSSTSCVGPPLSSNRQALRTFGMHIRYEEEARRNRLEEPKAEKETVTILYSHGNAEDVGLSVPYLEHVALQTCCDVFAWEYPGYSITEGDPSEQKMYDAARASYDFCVETLKIPPSKLVVFGRSIGSAPATDLVSKLEAVECAGLILQSPLSSGARVLLGNGAATVFSLLDRFCNLDKIKNVKVKTLIMHGEKDEVVPFSNGQALYRALNDRGLAVNPLWAPDGTHNNMPERQCLARVRQFVYTELKKQG